MKLPDICCSSRPTAYPFETSKRPPCLDRAVAAELPQIRRRIGTIPLLAGALAVVGVLGSKLLGAGALSGKAACLMIR